MTGPGKQVMLVLILAGALAIGAVINVVGPQPLRRACLASVYPTWFHRVSNRLDCSVGG